MIGKIGFMQGRLSPIINGRIQSFPWGNWENEIIEAKSLGFDLMEWTLDQEKLYENPIMTTEGRKKISKLCTTYNFKILSLTGDCFMQAPFWKSKDIEVKKSLQKDFLYIVSACSDIGIEKVVVPLVDDGSISLRSEEDEIIKFFTKYEDKFLKLGITILFESDYSPKELKRFITRLNSSTFGVSYDTGNSSALGFDPTEEFLAFGDRIRNVHIKDRYLNGTTVSLGAGDTNFPLVFGLLREYDYKTDFILQTARTKVGSHGVTLVKYRNMVSDWIDRHGS